MFIPTISDAFDTRLRMHAAGRDADETTASAFVAFVLGQYHATVDFERTADLAAIWTAFSHVSARPFDSRLLLTA